jgi:hypothetical protein
MKLGAVIVENRGCIKEAIDRHMWAMPRGTQLVAITDIDIKTLDDYNRLLVSKEFWEPLAKFDRVLIFQKDSGILREGIEEFYGWSYIGADLPSNLLIDGMNGGLSLRSPKKCLEAISAVPWKSLVWNGRMALFPEDMYFSIAIRCKMPPKEIRDKFSVETKYKLGSLGYHGLQRWHSKDKIESIMNQYKEL